MIKSMQPTPLDKSSPSSILPEEKRDWISLLNESVHTSDDIDISDICCKQKLCSCNEKNNKYSLLLYSYK
jgi:hypothetical protein